MWIRSEIDVRTAIPEKQHFRRSESFNTKYRFQGQLPFVSLADYYIKDLILEQ